MNSQLAMVVFFCQKHFTRLQIRSKKWGTIFFVHSEIVFPLKRLLVRRCHRRWSTATERCAEPSARLFVPASEQCGARVDRRSLPERSSFQTPGMDRGTTRSRPGLRLHSQSVNQLEHTFTEYRKSKPTSFCRKCLNY